MKFRIVTYQDRFKIQYSTWIGWITLQLSQEYTNTDGEACTNYYEVTFSSVEKAEEFLKEKYNLKKDGEVVKEISFGRQSNWLYFVPVYGFIHANIHGFNNLSRGEFMWSLVIQGVSIGLLCPFLLFH